MAGHIDSAAEKAHNVLIEFEADEVKKAEMVKSWNSRKGAIDGLRENRQFILEVILVRHIENFLGYLASLLYEIFTQRPETLSSSEHIEISKVIKHDSIESLVREIAERKVESLSYSSFLDLVKFFNDRFHIKLADGLKLEKITHLIEVRNISVHNRCVMNQRFVSRLGLPASEIGKKKELYIDQIDELNDLVAELVKHIDRQSIASLNLKSLIFKKALKNRVKKVTDTFGSDAKTGTVLKGTG